jgi:hypothetical protein
MRVHCAIWRNGQQHPACQNRHTNRTNAQRQVDDHEQRDSVEPIAILEAEPLHF